MIMLPTQFLSQRRKQFTDIAVLNSPLGNITPEINVPDDTVLPFLPKLLEIPGSQQNEKFIFSIFPFRKIWFPKE